MRVRLEEQGGELELEEQPLGKGGEAMIYGVVGRSEVVAKLFHQPTAERAAKLAAMLAAPPSDPMAHAGHTSITWPRARLFAGDNRFLGYLMPRIDGARLICEYYNPGPRLHHAPLFHYGYLLRTARNLAAAVRVLHERGYVVGDLNESNILVNGQALVSLVDTDSFQVRTASTTFRCRVGRAAYTPPELHGARLAEIDRRPEHDAFGLAVLIFQLLMQGTHPFAGISRHEGPEDSIPERIRAGHWPYSLGRELPVRPSPHAPPWDVLSPHVQSLFRRCFEDGHTHPRERPNAESWRWALADAEKELVRCPANPQHHFHHNLDVCPWCTLSLMQGRDPFPPPAPRAAARANRRGEAREQAAPASAAGDPPPATLQDEPASIGLRRRDFTLALRDVLLLLGIAALAVVLLWMWAVKMFSSDAGL